MKKIFIICTVLTLITLSLHAGNKESLFNYSNQLNGSFGDWREGVFNRDVSEHLIIVNAQFVPVITKAFKNTTNCGLGFTAGYEYKLRPSIIHNQISFGFGGFIGIFRYFGKSIDLTAVGNDTDKQWDKYKSYTEIPLMLTANVYYNIGRSNIFLGIGAGINLMLGEKDARVDTIGPTTTSVLEDTYNLSYGRDVNIISIQKDENNVSLNHVIPTLRFEVGYMYEISPDFRLRAEVGLEYQAKYFDEYKGFRLDHNYYQYYHQHDSPSSLNPYISIGVAYSL